MFLSTGYSLRRVRGLDASRVGEANVAINRAILKEHVQLLRQEIADLKALMEPQLQPVGVMSHRDALHFNDVLREALLRTNQSTRQQNIYGLSSEKAV